MILVIHTSDISSVFIGLIQYGHFVKKKKFTAQYRQAEKLLPAIEKMFQASGLKFQDIKGIAVVSGPGPFTAVRIGVVTANALSYSLRIPVVAVHVADFTPTDTCAKMVTVQLKKQKKSAMVLPVYNGEPNITIRKK